MTTLTRLSFSRRVLAGLLAAVMVVLLLPFGLLLPPAAAAGMEERSPYGGFRGGPYGERRRVETAEDAHRVLRDYFGRRDVRIGEIREKELYFEADILDRHGALVDKVIVNKRTGRIRSIY